MVPDTRFPLSDFQGVLRVRGEVFQDVAEGFGGCWGGCRCGFESAAEELDKTRGGLEMQADITSGTSVIQVRGEFDGGDGRTVLVTKVQVWLVPSKFKFGPKIAAWA
jgi:hypothetical protein